MIGNDKDKFLTLPTFFTSVNRSVRLKNHGVMPTLSFLQWHA